MFWRSLPMEFSWHYERQMHMGFCSMISAGLKKIYRNNPKGLSEALQRHLEFFNITPHVSTFVGGITLAMEEMNATQEDFDSSSINAVKAALMGPLSGITWDIKSISNWYRDIFSNARKYFRANFILINFQCSSIRFKIYLCYERL